MKEIGFLLIGYGISNLDKNVPYSIIPFALGLLFVIYHEIRRDIKR